MSQNPFDTMFAGLSEEAQRSDEPSAKKAAPKPRPKKKTHYSVYAAREPFERVKIWARHLGVSQHEIIERAWNKYCDELAELHNDGEDPRPMIDDAPGSKLP